MPPAEAGPAPCPAHASTRVEVLHHLDGARRAAGVAVILDVFRAFTLAPCAIARGARSILPVGTADEAWALKRTDPTLLLAGESDGRPLPGFDFSNSPAAMLRQQLRGRTLVLRTSAGVQGLLAANQAEEVITGSFVNAAAIVAWLQARRASRVSLVAMGWNACEPAAEDEACAAYLAACLRGESPDFEAIRTRLRADPSGAKFFDPSQPWFPPEDFEACLRLSAYPFVLRRARDAGGRLCLERVDVPLAAGQGSRAL
jgi:2-phosphosulfolactate phosphatase